MSSHVYCQGTPQLDTGQLMQGKLGLAHVCTCNCTTITWKNTAMTKVGRAYKASATVMFAVSIHEFALSADTTPTGIPINSVRSSAQKPSSAETGTPCLRISQTARPW